MADGNAPYPGSKTDPADLLLLANQYRLAFQQLRGKTQKLAHCLVAPAALCAIHAVELYLQVVLRCDGVCSKEIRGKHHSLSEMAAYPEIKAITLRRRNREHLAAMTERRE